jgi:hypothetical protein
MINQSDINGDDSDKSISESDSSGNSIEEEIQKLGLRGTMPGEDDDADLTEEERKHLDKAMKDYAKNLLRRTQMAEMPIEQWTSRMSEKRMTLKKELRISFANGDVRDFN